LALLLLGCPDEVTTIIVTDAGVEGDASVGGDVGPGPDLGATRDQGVVPDEGLAPDAACDPAPGDPTPPPDGGVPIEAVTAPTAHHGCLDDRLFVEVPASSASALPPETFETLAGALLELDPRWFCPADAECPSPSAELRPLLPPLELPDGLGADAGARFLRIYFRRGDDPAPIEPDRLGDVIAFVRAVVASVPGAPAVYVGRECVAHILGVEPGATEAMRSWHLDRLGAEGGGADGAPVDVMLVDTGVPAALAATLDIDETDVRDLAGRDGDDEGPPHPHGGAMALFVEQLASNARIGSIRALGRDGMGAIGDVAAGIAVAVQARGFGDTPTVINLSVGWPPELGRPRLVPSSQGPVTEDPAGESVRYMLALAGQLSTAAAPLVTIAAAGNRPGHPAVNERVYEAWFGVDAQADPPTGCPAADLPTGPPLFYPAYWSRLPSCVAGQGPRFLTWAVGAIDDRDRDTALTIRGAQPPLVAPGQLVYAAHDALPAAAAVPVCSEEGTPDDGALRSPTAVTGTSVAAALTSGAIARLLGAGVDLTGAASPASALRQLAWATGVEVAGAAFDSAAIRRLNLCRALAATRCSDVVACAVDGPDDGSFDRAVDCAGAVTACAPACPDVEADSIEWPEAHRPLPPVACRCDRAADRGLAADGDCGDPEREDRACPYELGIDAHSLGTAGGQPGQPTCPDCSAFVRDGGPTARLDAWLELSSAMNPRTVVDSGFIVLRDSAGSAYSASLQKLSPVVDWKRGNTIVIKDARLSQSVRDRCLAGACSGELVTYTFDKAGKPKSKQVAPLRLTVK